MTWDLVVSFCGERYEVCSGGSLTLGRDSDVVIDDNPFLHRRFLQVLQTGPVWCLANIGQTLTATVGAHDSTVEAWLAPGGVMPLVFERSVVWFTAGATTYDFEIELRDPLYLPSASGGLPDGQLTEGRVSLTSDQHLLLVALCEGALRREARGPSGIPSSADAAERLGWTLTKFNRKLDNVCDKLSRHGVRGLHGSSVRLASNRRSRLVEYAMTTSTVTKADLPLLTGSERV